MHEAGQYSPITVPVQRATILVIPHYYGAKSVTPTDDRLGTLDIFKLPASVRQRRNPKFVQLSYTP